MAAMAGPGLVVDGLVGLDPDHQLVLRLLLASSTGSSLRPLALSRNWDGGAKEAAWRSFLEPTAIAATDLLEDLALNTAC